MIRFISLFLLIISFLNAYEVIDKKDIFTVKIKNGNFESLYVNLKDEINYESYIIVHELDLGKSTKAVADALEKNSILKNSKNLMLCKSTLTLQMHEENIENATYCPMVISIYEHKNSIYLSFRKYHAYKANNKIANIINQNLRNIILKSLD